MSWKLTSHPYFPTRFPDLNGVLAELVQGIQAALGANLVGIYLQGSFGGGDADEDSDVDFLVAIHQPLSIVEVAALQSMHEHIYDLPIPWARHLEGSYFPKDLLRREDPSQTKLWYLDNTSRVLEQSTHDNTLVVRWQTRQHGIPLTGPDPTALIDPIHPDDLRREVRAVMRDWGGEIFSGRYIIDNCWAQAFAVISYCRMLQTLQTATIESKPAGVSWALEHLDPRWADMIQRAWANRPDPSTKYRTPADTAEVVETIKFIRYANQLIGENMGGEI